MNPKKIKTLAIIFTGLLLVAASPWIKERVFPEQGSAEKFEEASVNFSRFSKENTKEISIKRTEKETVLILKDGNWMVGDKEASVEKITALFQDFQTAEIQKQASKNKENHSRLGVDGEQSTTLTITSGDDKSIFFIGKSGPMPNSFYARKKGVANTYLVEGVLKTSLLVDEEDWIKEEKTESPETEEESTTLQMP